MLHGHSKQQLVSMEVRRIWAKDLHTTLHALESAAKTNRLSRIDWVAAYLFVFWSLIRMVTSKPASFPTRKWNTLPSRHQSEGLLRIEDLKQYSFGSIRTLLQAVEDFKTVSLQDLFIKECLPGFSQHISVFFTGLQQQSWKVQILEYVPTPEEVLKFQQQGHRCISLLSSEKTLAEELIDGKDPFKFALHDIEHAFHFFKDESLRLGQIGFYKKMDSLIEKLARETFWQQTSFKKDFNYLISDMNSHCVHLTKTLHAILLKAHGDQNFNRYWENLFSDWDLADETRASFYQVNLQNFSDVQARTIENYFLNC